LYNNKLVRAVKDPSDEGMVPVKVLLPNPKLVRAVKAANDEGMVPVS
jgi:hypothetical protein